MTENIPAAYINWRRFVRFVTFAINTPGIRRIYHGGGGLLKSNTTRLYPDCVQNCPNSVDRHASVVGPQRPQKNHV